MKTDSDLQAHLIDLRSKRRLEKQNSIRRSRTSLTAAERLQVLAKTSGACHICGGKIEGKSWRADHVIAHSAGGTHDVDNYLPAHATCNNYRWGNPKGLSTRRVPVHLEAWRVGKKPD
jgi:5-methylcytosine-specific restriction endonuclease McrA